MATIKLFRFILYCATFQASKKPTIFYAFAIYGRTINAQIFKTLCTFFRCTTGIAKVSPNKNSLAAAFFTFY